MASPSDLQTPAASPRQGPASRLMLSVKRTLTSSNSSRRRPPDYQTPGLLSTQEESTAPPPLHFREPDPAKSRPTIEQIAMGLHLSRTPHLRAPYAFPKVPLSTRSHDHRSSSITLPPPPSRSSMKKSSTTITSSSSGPVISTPFSSASASTTTVTSVTPSAANPPKSFAGLKFRMPRFLPHNRSSSAPASAVGSPLASPRNSVAEALIPKKAVRFHTVSDESMEGN